MMLYGRLVHVVPFLAVALLEACGGGDPVHSTPRTATPGIAVGEPHPQPAAAIRDFELLSIEGISGITAKQNVVIRSEAEFSALWSAHTSNRLPAPALPKVDFSKQMVVGVFAGQLNHGCGSVTLHHARNEGAKMTVSYAASTAHGEVCPAVMGSPALLAAVERSEAPVDFVAAESTPVALATVDKNGNSDIKTAKVAIVKDQAAWETLWREHNSRVAAPAIDFSRQMVVATFMGEQVWACNDVTLHHALRAGKVVTVRRTVSQGGPDIFCIQGMTSPSHMVALEKTDEPVVIATLTEAM